ncbi:unnamed protein product, partial [Heterosigma akashiwo]
GASRRTTRPWRCSGRCWRGSPPRSRRPSCASPGAARACPYNSWYKDMQISRRQGATETSLPVSHTCFFSVELPPY